MAQQANPQSQSKICRLCGSSISVSDIVLGSLQITWRVDLLMEEEVVVAVVLVLVLVLEEEGVIIEEEVLCADVFVLLLLSLLLLAVVGYDGVEAVEEEDDDSEGEVMVIVVKILFEKRDDCLDGLGFDEDGCLNRLYDAIVDGGTVRESRLVGTSNFFSCRTWSIDLDMVAPIFPLRPVALLLLLFSVQLDVVGTPPTPSLPPPSEVQEEKDSFRNELRKEREAKRNLEEGNDQEKPPIFPAGGAVAAVRDFLGDDDRDDEEEDCESEEGR